MADIKARFIGDNKERELPQHNSLLSAFDPDSILKSAAKYLDFDMASARMTKKIGVGEKDNRDLLIYLLWEAGRLSHYAIGDYFGLTYSAISRRVKLIRDNIGTDLKLRDKYVDLKSKIKV